MIIQSLLFFSTLFVMNIEMSYASTINSPACGIIQNIRKPSLQEKLIMTRAACLVQKLLPPQNNSFVHPIVWDNLYLASSSKSCHGLTIYGTFRNSTKVFVFNAIPNENKLLAMNQLGTTLLHEFHHYWTNSKDNGKSNDPRILIDEPALEGFRRALLKTYPPGQDCVVNGLRQPIKNELQKQACKCGILPL